MKRITAKLLIFTFIFSFHMPAFAKKEKEASALDKRAAQTKIYDTKSESELMKMALNVIQDEEYKIINLDNELSLVTAMKQSARPRPLKVKIGYYTGFILMSGISFGIYSTIFWIWIKDAHTPYNVENTITLNVSELTDKKIKIRINTNEKVFAPHTGSQTTLKTIIEAENEFYQDFYVKMDKESFITRQDL
ncbi:MAG: hypothetical protein A2287_07310 [Candidatus Melainabacteria bacterium RIFOXYA12_FULL_32_12]|nr:MAG: hypothetical protein A2287_07310 [Candidatus Melainabacteria bacterium RIFOXYA12_FULL_32_12]